MGLYRRVVVMLPAALLLAGLSLAGCVRSQPPPSVATRVQELSREAAGDNLRVLRDQEWIYLTYPDLEALSLNLLRLGPAEPGTDSPLEVLETTYLDRISETPEIGEDFGNALLVLRDGVLNVFYSDREREGMPVLKAVSGPGAGGKWWIDILPYPGQPLAVLPAGQDELDLYLLRGDVLVRQRLSTGDSEVLLNPCDPARGVSVLGAPRPEGITVFDRGSQRLYAFRYGAEGLTRQIIYTAGAAHSSLLREGLLRVLLYSPRDATLLLLEEGPGSDSPAFSVTPVTVCEGTTSVHLGYRDGVPYFLYNESAEDGDGTRSYLLSLLTRGSGPDGESRYRRSQLLRLDSPLRSFSVSASGSVLYIFFVQETLRVLALDLEALGLSSE